MAIIGAHARLPLPMNHPHFVTSAGSYAILMIVLLLLTPGCGDEVAAPAGVDEPFSVYGILNPRRAMQTIMVSPLETALGDYGDSIDAAVTSLDLTTAVTHVWRDSVVVGDRGQRDHIFVADFRPEFGSEHSIVVSRSDSMASSAHVRVPGLVTIDFSDGGSHLVKGRILGDDFRIVRAEITYLVRYYEEGMAPAGLCTTSPRGRYTLSLTGSEAEVDGGWELSIDLAAHADTVLFNYAREHDVRFLSENEGIALMDMHFEATIGNRSWNPPGGVFDEFVVSVPGLMTNVENGLGFVAGGYNQERTVWPSAAAVKEAGFYDFLMRPPGDCLNFCSCGWQ